MTRHAVLAEELYKLSLALKKTTKGTYFLKKTANKVNLHSFYYAVFVFLFKNGNN